MQSEKYKRTFKILLSRYVQLKELPRDHTNEEAVLYCILTHMVEYLSAFLSSTSGISEQKYLPVREYILELFSTSKVTGKTKDFLLSCIEPLTVQEIRNIFSGSLGGTEPGRLEIAIPPNKNI